MSTSLSNDIAIRIESVGKKFCRSLKRSLYYGMSDMVRNMVGTIVEVGKGKIKPEDIGRIMSDGNRNCAGPTAPARGLYLERIIY